MSEIKDGIDEKRRSLVRFVASLGSLIVVMVPIAGVLRAMGTPVVLVIALNIAVGWAWPQPSEWPFNKIGRDR